MATEVAQKTADVFGRFASKVQRTNELVAFGLVAAAANTTPVKGIPNLPLRFQHWDQQFTEAEIANGYSSWVLANGFRDLSEVVAGLFEEVNAELASWVAIRTPHVRGRKGKPAAITSDAFHRLDFPTKVTRLQAVYDLHLEGALLTAVGDVNAVRNCLVHRYGIVGAPDVKRGGALRLRYKTVDVFITEPNGSPVLFTARRTVAPGSAINFQERWVNKEWHTGDRVTLNPAEFSDVANTLNHFGLWTQRAMLHVAWGRRLVASAPPPMNEPLVKIASG